jgi:hypothetical protein
MAKNFTPSKKALRMLKTLSPAIGIQTNKNYSDDWLSILAGLASEIRMSGQKEPAIINQGGKFTAHVKRRILEGILSNQTTNPHLSKFNSFFNQLSKEYIAWLKKNDDGVMYIWVKIELLMNNSVLLTPLELQRDPWAR